MHRVLRSLLSGGLLLAGFPSAAQATFHIVSISELGSGFGGAAAVQFVELRLDAAGQTNTINTRLTVFAADGTATVLKLADHPLANGTNGANVLYATAAFAAATGVAPDFEIPAGLVAPIGMVCWGAPGIVPPPPNEWDFDKPNNYVDCVAYGGFTGATRLASGTPSALPPGDGTQSLARTKGRSVSGSNDVDFELATPNVCNNVGDCTDLTGGAAVCGDADGSGSVTVTDGVQVLRASAGLSSSCTPARCDVNDSGGVTVTDGVQVLRAAAGLSGELSCPSQ